MAAIGAALDHVVVLIPYEALINPPSWITDNFTLSPGGRHADNKTENKLVLFEDGTYIEFISFINDDPENRKGHGWDKPFGIVDFALTSVTKGGIDHEALRKRMESSETGVSYAEPQPGGRVTDGKEIKWRVTVPNGIERGSVPFFCEDITNRAWRVPLTEKNTTHPCGARGMLGLMAQLREDFLDRVPRALGAVLDDAQQQPSLPRHFHFDLRAPNEVEDLKIPSVELHKASANATRDLELILKMQTPPRDKPRAPIREHFDDGGDLTIYL